MQFQGKGGTNHPRTRIDLASLLRHEKHVVRLAESILGGTFGGRVAPTSHAGHSTSGQVALLSKGGSFSTCCLYRLG